MGQLRRLLDWLEQNWVVPSYNGWVLGAVCLAYFGAATNTMAGWLYALSGIGFALLGLAAFLTRRSLQQLTVTRSAIAPVSAGDQIEVNLQIHNPTAQTKSLLLLRDLIPASFGTPPSQAVEQIPPHKFHPWTYYLTTQKRGVYWWHEVQLASGNPLGLFWGRRSCSAKAKAVVYPTVIPLSHCPLVDAAGDSENWQIRSDRFYQAASEGITKALRPYRIGDPTRLIHWRTSARYGELKVRELEVFTGSQTIIIALDNALTWRIEDFEQAVTTAASLYFYAARQQLEAQLWMADTGLLHGSQLVLETLAATNYGAKLNHHLPDAPLIWLTANPQSLEQLPQGSRWLLWGETGRSGQFPGLMIDQQRPLQLQLQQSIFKAA